MRILVLLWCAGCVLYDDTTRVKVRDPAAVVATIHPDEPRYGDSWIARDDPGALDVWCPSCAWIKRRTPIAHNELALDGKPDELLKVDGAGIHMRFDFNDRFGCGRRRSCVRRALEVDLDTPRSNIETIRYEHRISSRNGESSARSLIGFGVGYAVAGALLAGFGVHVHERVVFGVGLAMITIGGGAAGFGLHLARAMDTITPISP